MLHVLPVIARVLPSGAELCIRPVSLTATTSTAKTTVEHFCNRHSVKS